MQVESEAPVLRRGNEIVSKWHDLAEHAQECPQCAEILPHLRYGELMENGGHVMIERTSRSLSESLCEVGQLLAGAWIQECEGQREEYRSWHVRTHGFPPPLMPPIDHPSHLNYRWPHPKLHVVQEGVCLGCGEPLSPRQIDTGKTYHSGCWRKS